MLVRLISLFASATVLLAANPPPPGVILEQGTNHWAFQPIRKPNPGENIDSFIRARLQKENLKPSAEATRAVLIRRLYFNLTGLPPAPEEIEAFTHDRRPDAYEKLVDHLLGSPRYGERWGRRWLDIVRFAESNGFETNTPRPNAWPYRDYVIRAFNEDVPFDRFVLEQLAGDVVGAPVGTGFLVGGPWDEVKSPDIGLTAQQRMDELHDMVATTGSTFLGLTIGCARCHNHKFDPIGQVDYYALQAVFAGVQHGDGSLTANPVSDDPPANPGGKRVRSAVNARLNIEKFSPVEATRVRFTILATTGAEPCIDELEIFDVNGTNVALTAKPAASGTYPNSEIHRLEHINDGKYGNSRSWISSENGKGWIELELASPARIAEIKWARDREQKFADRLASEYRIEASAGGAWKLIADSTDRLPPTAGQSGRAYVGRFEQPGPTHRLHRGEALQKKEQISPALPVRFARLELPPDTPEKERRLALAKWIANPENPLTARVIANRVWQFHFGAGLVDTPSDFGLNGAAPTHPGLLDFLAARLIENNWSLKRLQREILLSHAFRQSSAPNPEAMRADGASRLLWRFPPRRLEAEALRDAMLQVSGNLDLTMGGRGFDLFEPNENYVRVFNPKKKFGPGEWRRMVYVTKHRMQLDDTFGAFDCPDAGQAAPKRTSSTTPLQALNLLNSPFMLEQAELFAARLKRETPSAPAQINLAFRLAFGREPEKQELAAAKKLIAQEGLPIFCRALLNANEFVYVF